MLSPNLASPTPARLKEECIIVCHERFLKKDEKIFRLFLKPREDQAAYIQAFKVCPAAKFKPLNSFLKGAISTPSELSIELLAWLIDFEYRPQFDWERKQKIVTLEKNVLPIKSLTENHLEHQPSQSNTVPEGKDSQNLPIGEGFQTVARRNGSFNRIALTIFIICLMLIGGAYAVLNKRVISQGCMVWKSDHYEPLPCNKKIPDAQVIALDSSQLRNFKKVTRLDTVTANTIGKLWYLKANNSIELFTAPGFHPVHTERRLKPLSAYMLRKYIAPFGTSQNNQ